MQTDNNAPSAEPASQDRAPSREKMPWRGPFDMTVADLVILLLSSAVIFYVALSMLLNPASPPDTPTTGPTVTSPASAGRTTAR